MKEQNQKDLIALADRVKRLRDERSSMESMLNRLPRRQAKAKRLAYDEITMDFYFRPSEGGGGYESIRAGRLTPAIVDLIKPIMRKRIAEIDAELAAL